MTVADNDTCQFGAYDAEGNPLTECERTDYEVVHMGDDEYVRLCPKHRSWATCLAKVEG